MSDQALQIGAVATMWMALALIGLALFLDRVVHLFRPRRRCPKCWYDMSHSPSLTCSECGYAARRERRLFKGRRRWRLVWLALFLLLGSHALRVTPAVRQRGWVAAVPTVLLVSLLPPAGSEFSWNEPQLKSTENPFAAEMRTRISERHVSDWQLRRAIERCRIVRTRRCWPIDQPLRLGLFLPSWLSNEMNVTPLIPDGHPLWYETGLPFSGTVEPWHQAAREYLSAGTLEPTTGSVAVEVDLKGTYQFLSNARGIDWIGIITVPVTTVNSLNDSIKAVDSTELTAQVRRAVTAQIWQSQEKKHLHNLTIYVDRSMADVPDDVALGLAADFVKDGLFVRAIKFDDRIEDWFQHPRIRYSCWLTDLADDTKIRPAGWTLRIRGNAEDSLRDFDRPKYWAGEFEIPLEELFQK